MYVQTTQHARLGWRGKKYGGKRQEDCKGRLYSLAHCFLLLAPCYNGNVFQTYS